MRKNKRLFICTVVLCLSTMATLSAFDKHSISDSEVVLELDSLKHISPVPVVKEAEQNLPVEDLVNQEQKTQEEALRAKEKAEKEAQKREEAIEKQKKKTEKAEADAKKNLEKKEKELEKATKRREKEEINERKRLEQKEKDLQKEKKQLEKERNKAEKERAKAQKAKEKNEKALFKAEKDLKSKQKTYLKLTSKIQKEQLRLEHNVRLGSISPIAELEAKEKIGKKEIEAEKISLEMENLKSKIEIFKKKQ